MSHKDWKGPGWYDRWDEDRLHGSIFLDHNSMYAAYQYTLRMEPDRPLPKKELSDGLYTAIDSEECPITVFRKNNRWYSPYGNQCEDGYVEKVIGRISVEDIS